MEAGTLVDDLDTRKRKYYNEMEELEQEQRERENRAKLNNKFQKFAHNIEAVAKKNKFKIEFERPFSDLQFTGTPGKSVVKLIPTISCLVNLTEFPFYVLTVKEIEHIHFERVQF